MGKPTICIGENKGADQLRSNCEADQRLCFRCKDSTILLLKSEISSFYPTFVTIQADLCHTWLEPKLLVFSRTGSNNSSMMELTDYASSSAFLIFQEYIDWLR